MNTAYLLTGGNLGDRQQNLARARRQIEAECGKIVVASALYETAAWGKTDQPAFLNQVLKIHTSLEAIDLMKKILKLEESLGRIREEKFGPRIIDIDILLFNDDIINTGFLKVPHPEMQNRRFVLVPLVEIAPHAVHPVFKKTMQVLLQECPDALGVKKYA